MHDRTSVKSVNISHYTAIIFLISKVNETLQIKLAAAEETIWMLISSHEITS